MQQGIFANCVGDCRASFATVLQRGRKFTLFVVMGSVSARLFIFTVRVNSREAMSTNELTIMKQ